MYYLKYRPKSFSELVGLENEIKVLVNALLKNQVAHAYIFTGPKGSGKTTTARILAKALNCERLGYSSTPSGSRSPQLRESTDKTPGVYPTEAEPCNQCSACQAVNEGRFLDLIEIDAASNRGIDDVRSLREKIKLAPAQGKFKVYLIDEAHMLTPEAFNALLKTLEEPPLHAVFILCTTEFHKLPATIRSRCQILKFPRGKKSDLIKKLTLICKREGAEVTSEQIERVASLSEGGFRNAETLLEQVVVGEINLNKFDFSSAQFLDFLVSGKKAEALEFLSVMEARGESLAVFNTEFILYLRQLLLILGGLGPDILELSPEEFESMREAAGEISVARVVELIGRFLKSQEQEKFSPVPSLPMELAVFDVTSYFPKEDRPAVRDGPQAQVRVEEANLSSAGVSPALIDDGKTLTFDQIADHWEEILRAIRPFNHSLEALLRSSRPKEVSGDGVLVIEVFYKFHKDKLCLPVNLKILSEVFSKILGYQADIHFSLSERTLPKADSGNGDIVAAALEAFGS